MGQRKHIQTTEDFIEITKQRFNNEFDFAKTVFKGRYSPLTITCKKHGDFEVTPRYFMRSNKGCPYCGGRVNLDIFIEKSHRTHGTKYDYSKVVFKNTTTPVEIICNKHGSFWIEPYEHYSKKRGVLRVQLRITD